MAKCFLFIFLIFNYFIIFAQDTEDHYDDEYIDLGMAGVIIVYGERLQEFSPESFEANVLTALNGTPAERREFIENDFIKNAGFRRTGNINIRITDASEKVLSVLHGIIHPCFYGVYVEYIHQ